MFGLPAPLSRLIEKRSQTSALPIKPGRDFGNIWFVLLISGMARSGYLKQVVEAEQFAARDFGATAIFTDLDPGAFLLARLTGLPVATTYQTPMAQGIGSLPWKLLNSAVKRVLQDYRLPAQPVESLFHGPEVLKIIPSIPELEGTDTDRADVRYVGSLIGAIQSKNNFLPEAGKRYVFVYLGTGSISLNLARKVLPQVFPAGGTHICLVGAQSLQKIERLGNVEFRPYVPAEAVLPFCDWTICHGGQNTIIQSLQFGVPLIIFPGPIFERRFNARKVEENGAGKMGELPNFTAAWLQTALAKPESVANNAKLLGEKLISYGGAQAAIEEMKRWIHSKGDK
jgi:UDP:flavonoid glycosyltransferase YjiC (YdhE family)